VLGGLAGVAAAPLVDPLLLADTPPVSFVVVGDWGKGNRTQRAVAHAMGEAAAEVNSRFVLSVGDNFYPAGVRSVRDPQWGAAFEEVYTADSLQTPWYVALGNHDYRGRPHAQVAYSRRSHRWRMPSRYYKVSSEDSGVPGLDIFVIDTNPLTRGLDETAQRMVRMRFKTRGYKRQMAWLNQELAESKAPWKIVVGHHPVYSGAHGESPEMLDNVLPLLEAHGVQAYINGHDHDLQHIRRGSVDYICSGAGADAGPVVAVDGTQYFASRPGFAVLTLHGDALWLEFRGAAGQTLYRALINKGFGATVT
jgi:acid phosphatase